MSEATLHELTLEDLDKLTKDQHDIFEVYIDSYYFNRFRQNGYCQYSFDDRGEFFWFLTKKFRPYPYINSAVVWRTSPLTFTLRKITMEPYGNGT